MTKLYHSHLICAFLLSLNIVGCKSKIQKDSASNAEPSVVGNNEELDPFVPVEPIKDKPPISLFLLGDDSHIMSIDKSLLTPDPETGLTVLPIESEDDILWSGILLASSYENELGENPEEEEQLNLSANASAVVADAMLAAKRKGIRTFEKARTFYEDILKSSGKKIDGASSFQRKYLDSAIDKKRADAKLDPSHPNFYSKFNLIPEVKGQQITAGGKSYTIGNTGSGKIVLGMLPDEALLREARKQAGRTDRDLIDVRSVVEDFEMKKIMKEDSGKLSSTANPFDSPRTARKIEVADDSAYSGLVGSWKQHSTRDVRMPHREPLANAIADVVESFRSGRMVYVHCKSGKGRSNAVVVGANMTLIMDDIAQQGGKFSRKDLDNLIDIQMAEVKKARPEVVKDPGLVNALKDYAYRYAKNKNILT